MQYMPVSYRSLFVYYCISPTDTTPLTVNIRYYPLTVNMFSLEGKLGPLLFPVEA